MIKRNKVCYVIGLSLLVATISGCNSSKTTVDAVMEEINTTEGSDTEVAELDMDDVILQAGDSSITYREVLYYIYQAKQSYENELGSNVWDVVMEDGSTFEEYAREELLREITELKIICKEAKEENVTLSEETTAEAENEAAAFYSGLTEEEKETYGFQEELLKEIYIENALASKMYDMVAESTDTDVNEEDYRQVEIQYIQIMTNGIDADGNTIQMTDEEKEATFTWAKKVLKKSKKVEDFEAYAEEKTDADTVSLIFGKEDMPDEFGEAALALKTGEFSDVIEGESAFYILYCVSENVEDLTEEKIANMQDELEDEAFQVAYTKWSEQYGVTVSVNLWKKVQLKG